jgi:hypothetical protein
MRHAPGWDDVLCVLTLDEGVSNASKLIVNLLLPWLRLWLE